MIKLMLGDCLNVLKSIPDNSVDSIVTDPPYGINFMNKGWDNQVPGVDVWAECLRVLKPGGHLLAFAGTRTQHRMATRIEDAGFEIRDMIAWVYGSGFPKSMDVSKAIDAMDAAQERRDRKLRFTEWMRGTGLSSSMIDAMTGTNMGGHYLTANSQPAVATRAHFEALRPLFPCAVPDWVEQLVNERTVESENMKKREVVGVKEGAPSGWDMEGGTVYKDRDITTAHTPAAKQWEGWGTALKPALEPITVARKPFAGTVANNVLQHGTGAINIDGCRVETNDNRDRIGCGSKGGDGCYGNSGLYDSISNKLGRWPANLIHDGSDEVVELFPGVDDKSAARFFYCPKASKKDRDDGLGAVNKNIHPTVKPTDLMAYLCRLVTPPGGTVLDPFMGSGSTGKAAVREGFNFIGIELDETYFNIAQARINGAKTNG